ncbi:unnamed protein product [Owenia fusiformis]|uniref:Cyclin-dependent kinase inhibitor domain-containing protein n=1 Tax=Owenia fusiformis TaxID=6347 RepID=A0A8S4Q7H1_OWEFU|nr:unnamed protein product [Owenia fusiformis]
MSTRVDSPLLGRMDILNATRPRSVRRALFGPVDHEQVKSDLQRLKAEQSKVDQEKWNFDFTEEKPLPGAYKWVPIDQHDNSDDEDKDNVVITTHVRLQHSPVSESREDDQEHYITVKDGESSNSQETPSTCRKSAVPSSIDITAKSTQPKINGKFIGH